MPLPAEFQRELEAHCRIHWLSDDITNPDEIAAVFSYQHTHIGAELMASLPKLKAVTLDRVLARLLK